MRYWVEVSYPNAECIDVVIDQLNTHHYHSLENRRLTGSWLDWNFITDRNMLPG
jgi:hypothetical protein